MLNCAPTEHHMAANGRSWGLDRELVQRTIRGGLNWVSDSIVGRRVCRNGTPTCDATSRVTRQPATIKPAEHAGQHDPAQANPWQCPAPLAQQAVLLIASLTTDEATAVRFDTVYCLAT